LTKETPSLKSLEQLIGVDENDLPQYRYCDHTSTRATSPSPPCVSNAIPMMRYGDPSTSFAATIGRSKYDLLAKVKPPEDLMF
jgi:hypothetical protein